MDCSPPGFSVHGILQTRILVWVAFPFSKPRSLALQANSFLSEHQGSQYTCIYKTPFLPSHLLMDISVAFLSWLLSIMLLWILECIHLSEVVFSFPLDIYPGVKLLDHMEVLFLIFQGTTILFSTITVATDIPTISALGLPFLYILANTCYFLFFWWQPFWQRCPIPLVPNTLELSRRTHKLSSIF